MATTTTATAATQAVHVVTARACMLSSRVKGTKESPAPESMLYRGHIITQPWNYRAEQLDHVVSTGMVTVVNVPLDPPDAPARTYQAPRKPAELSGRTLPPIFGLRALIDALESEGCTVTGAAHYRELLDARDSGIPAPPSVLAMTAREVLEHAQLVATRANANAHIGGHLATLHRQADTEQAEILTAEADTYLDQIRPQWNTAVAELRKVRDLGVPATITPDKLVDLAPDKIAAWSALRSSNAIPTLVRITALRTAMATILNIAEGKDAEHHSYGITNPVHPSLTASFKDGRPAPAVPALQKWLTAAYDLDLVPVRDFTPDQEIVAAGHPLSELRAIARTIHTHNTKEN